MSDKRRRRRRGSKEDGSDEEEEQDPQGLKDENEEEEEEEEEASSLKSGEEVRKPCDWRLRHLARAGLECVAGRILLTSGRSHFFFYHKIQHVG